MKQEKSGENSNGDETAAQLYETPMSQTPQLLAGFYTLADSAERHARLHTLWANAVRRRMKWCGFDVTQIRLELNARYKGPRFTKMWLNGGEKKKNIHIKWWEQCYDDGFVSLTLDDDKGVADNMFVDNSVGNICRYGTVVNIHIIELHLQHLCCYLCLRKVYYNMFACSVFQRTKN